MLLFISYQFNNSDKDYNPFYESIKNLGNKWWHYIDTAWIIQTDRSIDQCNQILISFLESEDRLFIVDISGAKYDGWLPSKAWEWIKANNITGK